MGTKLGLYTFVCSEYKRRNDGCALRGARDTLVATGCSFISIAVAYPFNPARTKLQVQGVNGRSMLYTGVFNCLQTTVEHERIIGLIAASCPTSSRLFLRKPFYYKFSVASVMSCLAVHESLMTTC